MSSVQRSALRNIVQHRLNLLEAVRSVLEFPDPDDVAVNPGSSNNSSLPGYTKANTTGGMDVGTLCLDKLSLAEKTTEGKKSHSGESTPVLSTKSGEAAHPSSAKTTGRDGQRATQTPSQNKKPRFTIRATATEMESFTKYSDTLNLILEAIDKQTDDRLQKLKKRTDDRFETPDDPPPTRPSPWKSAPRKRQRWFRPWALFEPEPAQEPKKKKSRAKLRKVRKPKKVVPPSKLSQIITPDDLLWDHAKGEAEEVDRLGYAYRRNRSGARVHHL